MFKKYIALIGLLLPGELIWTMGSSGLLKPYLGGYYPIVQFQTIVLIGIFIYFSSTGFRAKPGLLLVCILFFFVGFYELIATYLIGGNSGIAFQQLIFGFITPICLILFIDKLSTDNQLQFFKFFFIGYSAYLLTAFYFLFFIDDNLSQQIESYGIGGAIVSLRYQNEDSIFSLLLGNFNKQSNYLILSLFLAPCLLRLEESFINGKADFRKKIFIFFSFISVVALFLLFSRAALFFLFIVIFMNRGYYFNQSWRFNSSVLLAVICLTFYFYDIAQPVFSYLLFSNYVDGTSGGAIGTFERRSVQWEESFEWIFNPNVMFHGIGIGTYGVMINNDINSGMHNLFLDHWIASGVLGPTIIMLLVIFGLFKALVKNDWRNFLLYIMFLSLAFREYSFSYLYVTSMGGFMFILIIWKTYNVQGARKIKKIHEAQ